MRVLVVEDDTKIADFVVQGLKQAGFAVDHRTNGEDGLHLALTEPYDTAVIDLMLPKLDGLSLIEELRRQKVNTPVIILSAKRSVDDRVRGLHTGGDDYLTKPFAFVELLARVQALIRRASGVVESTRLTVGDISLDLLTRQVVRAGKSIDLQPREFALLEYLLRHAALSTQFSEINFGKGLPTPRIQLEPATLSLSVLPWRVAPSAALL